MSKETDEYAQQEISGWTRFKNAQRWKQIVHKLEAVIESCNNGINTPGTDSEIKYSKRDILIIKKSLAEQLKELPEYMAQQYKGTIDSKFENEDAFMDMFEDGADDPDEDK